MDELTGTDWVQIWASDVLARGGVPTRAPAGVLRDFIGIDLEGELAGRFPDHWEAAPLEVRLRDQYDRAIADSVLVDYINNIGDTLNEPPGQMVTDFSSGATTAANTVGRVIPWWAYAIAAVVAYGTLVQVGILPPLNKLFKE
jgi:hypothetical protein